jgi:hypothetical protein
MAHSITLGEVAQRTDVLDLRCGRAAWSGQCSAAADRARPAFADSDVMHAQIGDCPKRDDAQIQNHCDPYCLGLVRLFRTPETQP